MSGKKESLQAPEHPNLSRPWTWVRLGSPVYLLLTVTASIFVVEMAVMLVVLPSLPDLPAQVSALLDASTLVLGVFPTLLFALFRPLARQNEERLHLIGDLNKGQELLERAVSERTSQLSALYDVTAMSSQSMDLATILDSCLERVLGLMDSHVVAIQLLSEQTGLLGLAASRGAPPDATVGLDSVPRDYGLAGVVIARAEPTLVSDVSADARSSKELRRLGCLTYLGVPIKARGRVLGVLSILRDKDRPFTNEEEALVSAIGRQLGVVVENARLVVAVQGKAALEERQRLARDLHDSVSQMLYSLTLVAEAGRRLAGAGELAQATNHLERLAETSQQALKETRLLVYELWPSSLAQTGLLAALQQRLDAVERRAGVQARLVAEGDLSLGPQVEEGLYRIAQEALNNALKHSAAVEVAVRIAACGSQVELEVSDNGKGFDVAGPLSRGGLGLLSMRQRAEHLGASFSIVSAPAVGVSVVVVLPLGEGVRRESSWCESVAG